MHTIAIVNQKGGCGKTTTAINLAGVFAGRGHRTLLVDMDPQSHCAAGLAIPENRIDLHIGDAMLAGEEAPVDPTRLLWRVSRNLDLAPSTLRLAALEASRGELSGKADAERRLAQVLKRFDCQYDVCLIDCSPAIGMLAFNALVAADEVLIPVETGFFSLQGATKQISTIKSIGKRLGVAPVHRVLATMYDPESVLSKDLLEELRRRFTNKLIPVVIRYDQSLRESASFGQPVTEYAPDSQGAKDYIDLAAWLMANSLSKGENWRAEVAAEPGATIDAVARQDATTNVEPNPTPMPANRAADVASRAMKLHARQADTSELVNSETPPVAHPGSMVESKGSEPVLPLVSELRPPPVAEELGRTSTTHGGTNGSLAASHLPPVPSALVHTPWPPIQHPHPPHPPHSPMAFGPQITPSGVMFRVPVSIGRSVAVAGDFNQWMPERTPMRLNPTTGALEGFAFMPPGCACQYRLVIDGNWVADPYNPSIVPNPFGGTNSLISIPMMSPEIVVPGFAALPSGYANTIQPRRMA